MQHKDRVAFVAGTWIGLWAGALGAFLICTAVPAATYRLLNLLDERYLELRLPAALVRQLAGDQFTRTALAIRKVDGKGVTAG
jgi:hypothetical protein